MELCLTTSRNKTRKKNLGLGNWGRNEVCHHFLTFASLVFLDIAQNCRLGQYQTSSRAETTKKRFVTQFRT